MSGTGGFPAWPPGFWRRIVVQPGAGWIAGALEDDIHRFHLRFDHDGERIRHAAVAALRHPWTACPDAAPHLGAQVTGRLLADVAREDPLRHCTHIFDLAVLCAANANDTAPVRFDMRVADRVGDAMRGRTTATLAQDGAEAMCWQVEGTEIAGPVPFAGRELRQLSQWKHDLDPVAAEHAMLLRRAIYVAGARKYEVADYAVTAVDGPIRLGACFNYQRPQAETSTRLHGWKRDWSLSGEEPLGGFDPTALSPDQWRDYGRPLIVAPDLIRGPASSGTTQQAMRDPGSGPG